MTPEVEPKATTEEPVTTTEEPEVEQKESNVDPPESEAKLLSDEAARYRNRAKAAEKERDELKAQLADHQGDELKEMEIQRDFYRNHGARFKDLEAADAALGLLDKKLIESHGVDRATEHVLSRYPFLARDEKAPPVSLPTSASGSQFNGPKKSQEGLDMEALKKRFPSLRRR